MLSDHVLRSIRRQDLLLPFYLGGGSKCEDVLLEIALSDKIFKILTEELTLRSLISLAVVEEIVVSRFGTSRVMCFYLRMLHSGLTLNGFEDVLNRELQRSEMLDIW